MLYAPASLAKSSPSAATTVTIHADRPGPQINKNIYGQFSEHLGSGMYGGLWVGERSKIPNVRGFRKDVVGALKKLGVPVVRWPRGSFAPAIPCHGAGLYRLSPA